MTDADRAEIARLRQDVDALEAELERQRNLFLGLEAKYRAAQMVRRQSALMEVHEIETQQDLSPRTSELRRQAKKQPERS